MSVFLYSKNGVFAICLMSMVDHFWYSCSDYLALTKGSSPIKILEVTIIPDIISDMGTKGTHVFISCLLFV